MADKFLYKYPKLKNADVLHHWHDYINNKTIEARNELIIYYLPLVKYIIFIRFRRAVAINNIHHNSTLDIDDMFMYGLIGLIKCIESYDIKRNNEFTSYAAHRIAGSILDAFRKTDLLSRPDRELYKDITNQLDLFNHKNGKTCNNLTELNINQDVINKYHRAEAARFRGSIDRDKELAEETNLLALNRDLGFKEVGTPGTPYHGYDNALVVIDDKPTPEDNAIRLDTNKRTKDKLIKILKEHKRKYYRNNKSDLLTPAECRVIKDVYIKGKERTQLYKEYGVTASAVSGCHRHAINKLKKIW